MQEITVVSPTGDYVDAGYAILGIGLLLLSIGTILLYIRGRTKPTLVMVIAVIVGWAGVALAAFGPEEAQQVQAYSTTDSSGRVTGGAYSFELTRALMLPGFLAIVIAVLGWGGGFILHALSLANRTYLDRPLQ